MKIHIIRATSSVLVDGEARVIDMTDMDADINFVHFDTATHRGQIEYAGAPQNAQSTKAIGKQQFDLLFGKYVQRWKTAGAPARTPQKIAADAAAQAQALADMQAVVSAKADPVINYLVTHTPAECAQYVQTNVTNLATAKDVLAKMAMALSVLARSSLRD